jgi:hypothetical protein
MQEITDLVEKLRKRIKEFHLNISFENTSIHINAIEIAICLVEYSIKTNPQRPISKEEEKWFEAGRFVELVLGNSEWMDIIDLYYNLVTQVKKENYFR